MNAPVPPRGDFAVADWWRAGVQLGLVTAIDDPDGRARVEVILPAIDPAGAARMWARVAVPYAGANYGAFLLPDVGSEVLVAFIAGDFDWPVVIGTFWNGATPVPERVPGEQIDRWTLSGRNGSRIAIVEPTDGQEEIDLQLPSGTVGVRLNEAAGGKLELKAGGTTVTLSAQGLSITTMQPITANGSSVRVTASTVQVDTAQARVSGALDCAILTTNSVVSPAYTPGAGNVW